MELPYLRGKRGKCITLQHLLKIILTLGLMQQGLFCSISAPRASVCWFLFLPYNDLSIHMYLVLVQDYLQV